MIRLSHSAMVTNILHVYSLATTDEHRRGAQWYPLAHAIIVEWAETFGRSIANVASIVAALSPQLDWPRNLVTAHDVLLGHTPTVHCFRENYRKACIIRDENLSNPAEVFKVGCKVVCFAVNLAGDYQTAVTLDTHAGQIALGSPLVNARLDSWRLYQSYHAAYVDAALRVNLLSAHLQAITWLTWKRLYPAADKRTLRRNQ